MYIQNVKCSKACTFVPIRIQCLYCTYMYYLAHKQYTLLILMFSRRYFNINSFRVWEQYFLFGALFLFLARYEWSSVISSCLIIALEWCFRRMISRLAWGTGNGFANWEKKSVLEHVRGIGNPTAMKSRSVDTSVTSD